MPNIVHVDMDAFFANIELMDNPEYRGTPVIVGGTRTSTRGVVSTCCYLARSFGVRSAMPIRQAVRLCPHGMFLPTRMERYSEVSRKLHQTLQGFTPVVEPLSVDEAFLDMHGCEHFYPSVAAMGGTIKKTIQDELGLSASVGIAPNKYLAKLASESCKPNGLKILVPEAVPSFLSPLPVEKLWGIGPKTATRLHALGWHRVEDMRNLTRTALVKELGNLGMHVHDLVHGVDRRPVIPHTPEQSLGHENTYAEDLTGREELRRALADIAAHVGRRLRKKGLLARRITLKIRYSDFTTMTRSLTLAEPHKDDNLIFEVALRLLEKVPVNPVRLLGIYLSGLTEFQQPSLFGPSKNESLDELMDQINSHFPSKVIRRARETL